MITLPTAHSPRHSAAAGLSWLHGPARALSVVLCLLLGVSAVAQQPAAPATSNAFETAVAKGVAFLRSQQTPQGAFGGGYPNAFTSLSIMALAAVGHQPTDDTPEGKALAKGLEFILGPGRQTDAGYYGAADGSRMYGHGIVTLMLAEMLGMGVDARQDAEIRQRLQKAVDLIIQANKSNPLGGWRYEPASGDADISVTAWQVMALRAAKSDGLDVPSETIDRAVGFLKRCFHPSGACGYTPGAGPSYSSAAAGLLALQVCGLYDAPEVIKSAEWLRANKPPWGFVWFFYGTYYYGPGMYQRGGEFATEAQRVVEQTLFAHQLPDGSWSGAGQEADKIYATAMALLALSVRHHYMPIYQR